MGFDSRVEAFDFPLEKIKQLELAGVVLSGGPASVLSAKAPHRDLKALVCVAPLMGICYGLQLICREWGGKVSAQPHRRSYGKNLLYWQTNLFTSKDKNVPAFAKKFTKGKTQKVWMSHGDHVSKVPKNFSVLAKTNTQNPAVLYAKNILALQFHPEVSHTENGTEILSYFAEQICKAKKTKSTTDLALLKSQIKKQVPLKQKVLCALSGGVDSTVMALLLTKALGPHRIHCVFVDTGLLRKDEFADTLSAYKKMGLNVIGLSKETRFLSALKGVKDPERKRKIIGKIFIDIFKEYGKKHSIKYLAQGTLYPDVIESLSFKGPGAVIKSHHNVGGLPKKMPFKLVEPLRFLFKDEVRVLGTKLKVPAEFICRHPFPGPGLAVRICGEVTQSRLQKLRLADFIFMTELKRTKLYHKIWQAFAVLLPVKSVGVQGDKRTYDEVIVLRAITSVDGMTADWFAFPTDFLHKVSNKITNEVKGVNRVVLDLTSKPPGTIEWL